MAACDEADEHSLDHVVLADDDALDLERARGRRDRVPVPRRRPDAAGPLAPGVRSRGAHGSLVPVEVVGLGAGVVPEPSPRPSGSRAAGRRCGVSRGAGAELDGTLERLTARRVDDRAVRGARRVAERGRDSRRGAAGDERQDGEGDATGATGLRRALRSSGPARCSEVVGWGRSWDMVGSLGRVRWVSGVWT